MMRNKPCPQNARSWLAGLALLGLLGLFVYQKTQSPDRKEVSPERVGEQIRPGDTVIVQTGNGVPAEQVQFPDMPHLETPWQLTLPDGSQQKQYIIEPSEVYVRKADNQRVLEAVSAFSSIENLERHFDARVRSTGDTPYIVLYPASGPRNIHTRRLIGRKVSIQLGDASRIEEVARKTGAKSWRPLEFSPSRFILEAAHGFDTLKVWRKALKSAGVIAAKPLLSRRYQLKYIPQDPLYKTQWHLKHSGQAYPLLVGAGIKGYDLNMDPTPDDEEDTIWSEVVDADGQIVAVNGLRGRGVVVSILDDGIDPFHPDLAENVNAALDYDYYDNDFAPYHGPREGHGTAVAGVVAARGNNRQGNMYVGAHGVAPEATLLGLRLVSGDFDDEQAARALLHLMPGSEGFEGGSSTLTVSHGFQDLVDISNNSWGPTDAWDWFSAPGELTSAAIAHGVKFGRKGRGLIYVWAGGDGGETGDNSNYDGFANSIHTIAVGASTYFGHRSSHSEPGTNLLISAPSGGGVAQYPFINGFPFPVFPTFASPSPPPDFYPATGTVDRVGMSGYDQGDYNPRFNGTSASAPMVSGVIALMLEANPALGWRDVQEILLSTATVLPEERADWFTIKDWSPITNYTTGQTVRNRFRLFDRDVVYVALQDSMGALPPAPPLFQTEFWAECIPNDPRILPDERGDWITNKAGFRFNADYGAGNINAADAVALAIKYKENPKGRVLGRQFQTTITQTTLARPIPSGDNPVEILFEVTDKFRTEHVTLEVDINHDDRGQMQIDLMSPGGTSSNLLSPHPENLFPVIPSVPRPSDTNAGLSDGGGIHNFTFSTLWNWGENSEGTWTVSIRGGNIQGQINSLNLTIYGSKREAGVVVEAENTADPASELPAPLVGDYSLTDSMDANTAIQTSTYEIEIDGNGATDTFLWKKNGLTLAAGIAITGSRQEELSAEGLFILFPQTMGYTVGTTWALVAKDDTDHDGISDEWEEKYTTNANASSPIISDISNADSPQPLTDNFPFTISGKYEGVGVTHFEVESDGAGAFRWGLGGLKPFEATAVKIQDPNGSFVDHDLAAGIQIRFNTTSTGKWTFSALELSSYFDDSHLDPDGDNRSNLLEYLSKTNPIVKEDAPDDDGDSILNLEEILVYNTDPHDADTDGDGFTDGDEIHIHLTNPINPDTDGDGIDDRTEVTGFSHAGDLLNPNRKTDPHNPDTDKDGMQDGWERLYGLDPLIHDFIPLVIDTDSDNLPNYIEYLGADTKAPVFIGSERLFIDTDLDEKVDTPRPFPSDDLTDELKEYFIGAGISLDDPAVYINAQDFSGDFSDPTNADSDGDSFSDYEEYVIGTDPNDSGGSLRITGIASDEVAGSQTDSITWVSVPNKTYFLRISVESPSGPFQYLTDEQGNPLGILGKRESKRTTITHFNNGIQSWYRIEQKLEVPADVSFPSSHKAVGHYIHKIGDQDIITELDTDRDGLTDFYEGKLFEFYKPIQATGVYTSVSNFNIGDTDGDTILDGWEVLMGLDPARNDASEDLDNDGKTNLEEYTGIDATAPIYDYSLIADTVFRVYHGDFTRANIADSDADGLPDGWEILYGLEATIPAFITGTDIQFVGNNIISGSPEAHLDDLFHPGDKIVISGSQANDGIYTLDPNIPSQPNMLTTVQAVLIEPAGFSVTLAKDSDHDGLSDIVEYNLSEREPYLGLGRDPVSLKHGKTISSGSIEFVATDISFSVDEGTLGGPYYAIESVSTDLAAKFGSESFISVKGTVYNNGNYTIISEDGLPDGWVPVTSNKIFVREATDYETGGQSVTLDVDLRKIAFDGFFTYPDEADTDGDGATDGEEVSGKFGGSDPTDPNQNIATLTGKFVYSGIEQGNYYLVFTAYGADEKSIPQTDLQFDSATSTIHSTSGIFGTSNSGDNFARLDTFSIFGSLYNDGIFTVISSSPKAITVREKLIEESAGAEIFFRKNPQQLPLVSGTGVSGDSYTVSGIPSQLNYTISGFLDTNANGILDSLSDPHIHFLNGKLMPGSAFNSQLNIDLPHSDPSGASFSILSVQPDDPNQPLVRTITWNSVPAKTYRVRYSTDTPAGPFKEYVLGTDGFPKQINGNAGKEQASIIHFNESDQVFYRLEVRTSNPFAIDDTGISFVAQTRSIGSATGIFPPVMPGQSITIKGSGLNDGTYTISSAGPSTTQQMFIVGNFVDEIAGAAVSLTSPGAYLPELDTDNDGLTDFYEKLLGLDPGIDSDGDGNLDDTDLDGRPDGWDSDGDGMPDGWEALVKLVNYAADIRFSNNAITSIYGLSATSTDINFSGTTITTTGTVFPSFISGQKISVSGSGKNDGIYTLSTNGISADGKVLTVTDSLTNEVAGATVTVTGIGGTNLSIYPAGLTLTIKGSIAGNDGDHLVQSVSASQLTFEKDFASEDQDATDPHFITLYAKDSGIDADGDSLTNFEEYLGADEKESFFDSTLLSGRVFDGDFSNATLIDTDGDSMDDGWERKYGLDPNALNGVSGKDLAFRGLQVRSIGSIPISGRDFAFDTATNRIFALTTSFDVLQHARQITVKGSSSNDGTYGILSVDAAGSFIEVQPATPLRANENEGPFVSIFGDREILGNDISFDNFTLSSIPTIVSGKDIHFEESGAIRSLLGVFVEGQDIGFVGNQLSSHFGLTTGIVTDDISFDAATSEIRSLGGTLPKFVNGFQIQVAGANLNNGIFTVVATPTPGYALQVAEFLFDETEEDMFLPGTPKNITISSVGGTDLSVIPAGFEIVVTGSGFNDGVQTAAISTSNIITVLSGFVTELPGNSVRIDMNMPTDFSNFRLGQKVTVANSRRNNGEYTITQVSPNMLNIQFDPTGPSPLAEDPVNALTEASVQSNLFSNLSTFQEGESVYLNGSAGNTGIHYLNPFFSPTPTDLQVKNILVDEPAGQDLEIHQIGKTALAGFVVGDTPLEVLVSGSISNDGRYILANNGIASHALTFTPQGLFTNFVTEAAGSMVSISKDMDEDGLPDLQEYILKSDPTIVDTDKDGHTDLEEANARFLGSDSNNPEVHLTSLNGNIIYEGAEIGTIYVEVREHDSEPTTGSLTLDAESGSISGNLPFLVAGRKIEISGTAGNDGIYTVSSVPTPGSQIIVNEPLVDDAQSHDETKITVLATDPEVIKLPVGLLGYSFDRLPSGSKVSIRAYLDTNSNGEKDTFIDPFGEITDSILLGNPRYNLNITLGQGDLTLASVTPLDNAGTGFANAITWNSIPGKIYRILVSHDTPAGPYGGYVESLTGFPQEIVGRFPDENGLSQTYVVHVAEQKDTWYRLEMISDDKRTVTPELDSDGDGLTDYHELSMGLDPRVVDSDRDGMPDGWETLTGLTTHGSDISFDAYDSNNDNVDDVFEIHSIAGLEVKPTDLSFDSGTRIVTSITGSVNFSDFINGQQITISGSRLNDGTYTIIAEPTTTALTLQEQVYNEVAPSTGVSIASVGGTDLSVFHADAVLTIVNSVSNDGTYKLSASATPVTHTLVIGSGTLVDEAPDTASSKVTLYSSDAEADPDGDGLTNRQEFLGADEEPAVYDYSLVKDRLYSGDWTRPRNPDTDGDGITDGWEVDYTLNPNKIDELGGQDLSMRGNRIFSIANTQVSGIDISFDPLMNRILATSNAHFKDFTIGQLIRVVGSESNDGSYHVTLAKPNEIQLEEPLVAAEPAGVKTITIMADISVTSANLAMDESSIYSSTTSAKGGDVTFIRDRVESLHGYSITGTDLIFRDKQITSTSGLKYLVHESAPSLYALRGAEMTTEDGLTLNFVQGQRLIMRNLTTPFVDYYNVRQVEFGGEKVTFNSPPPFNQSNNNVEWTEIFTEPGSGTDLSLLVPGLQIQVKGSQFNDGIYTISDIAYGRDRWVAEDPFGQQRAPVGTLDYSLENNNTTTVLTLDTPTLFTNEALGREIELTVLNGTDLSEFRTKQEFEVSESYANNGLYKVASDVSPTPNSIVVHDHVFKEEPRLLATDLLVNDISFQPFGEVTGNLLIPTDAALVARHPVNDTTINPIRFSQPDLEAGGRGSRLNIIGWSPNLFSISDPDPATDFDDIYFQRGDVISGTFEVFPADPILLIPAVTEPRVYVVTGDLPITDPLNSTDFTTFINNTNAVLPGALVQLVNTTGPVATVFEPNAGRYELGEVVYDDFDGNYYMAFANPGPTSVASDCSEAAVEWIPLGPTPPHMGLAEEFSEQLSYDPGAVVQYENHIFIALQEVSLNQGNPTENSNGWIEPSLYLTSSLIRSHTGAIPKLVPGTKINVYVQWQGENLDIGGPYVDWPSWTLGEPDVNSGSYTVKNFISPFMIEVEEPVVQRDRFNTTGQDTFWSPLAQQLVNFPMDPQPPRNVRLFVNSYSTGENPEANLDLVRVDLSAFQPGQKLTIIDSGKNNGVYTISEEALAVSDRVYLQEPLYAENEGRTTTIFQSGVTDLSGFTLGTNFILGGTDANDGKYTVSSIKPNNALIEVSREFSQAEVDAGLTTALLTEATGKSITIGIDSDDDSLSNKQEYVGADGIAPQDPGDSSDATAPTQTDFDRDGYLDSTERAGYFGGSNAADINSIPSSISGHIDYSGTLDGEVVFRILEGDDPEPVSPNDISFISNGSIIRSSSGKLPIFLPGEMVHVKGSILTFANPSSTNIDSTFTVKEVITQGSEITVEEILADTPTAADGFVFLQVWDTPGQIELNLGEPGPYNVTGLPSHKTYHVDAFLDVGIKVASSHIVFDSDAGTISGNTDLFTEFSVGQTIRVTGSQAIPINDGSYTLTAVTGTTLTVAEMITSDEDTESYIIIQGLGNGVYDENAEPYGNYTFPAADGAIQLVSNAIPISHLNNINIQLTLPEPSIVEVNTDAVNGNNTVKWNSIAGKTYRILYSKVSAVGPYSFVKTLASRADIDSQRATLNGEPFEWDLNNDGITDSNEDLNGNFVLDTPAIGDTIDLTVTTVEGQSIASVEHFIEGNVWYRVEMENGFYDIAEQDSDADGISDFYENLSIASGGSETGIDVYDSDLDGMGDGWEVFVGLDPLDPTDAAIDADGDGLSHLEEYIGGDKVPAAYDYTRILTDVFAGDWTYSWPDDIWTISNNIDTNPRVREPDDLADGLDSDGDGMRDGWEVLYALNPNLDDSQDNPDNDGWDHDGNGVIEATEHYTNLEEYFGKDGGASVLTPANGLLFPANGDVGATFVGDHTNPQNPDTDGDSFVDGREADVAEGLMFDGSDPNDADSILMLFTGSLTSPNGNANLRIAISNDVVTAGNASADPVSGTGSTYKIADVPTGSYIVYAFEDQDVSGSWIDGEPTRTLQGFGNPTSAGVDLLAFSAVSPVVILDFELPAAAFAPSTAPTFAQWSVIEGLNGQGSEASADADGDGIPNFVEFAANTGPLDPDSKPEATFYFENTLGGLLEAEVPGFRMMTVSHPWNGILAGQVSYEIQVSEDLNQGWTTLTPGDGLLHSLSLSGDRIEAKIRCPDISKTIFTRFLFKETQ